MEETPVFLNMFLNMNINAVMGHIGNKQIIVKIQNQEKIRVYALLTILENLKSFHLL